MMQESTPSAALSWQELRPAAAKRPILGLSGWSGAGKTSLLCALIPLLREGGMRIALIKHAHHRFDVDHPGKDSYRLRKAGAGQVLLTSGQRYALMVERFAPRTDPVLAEELERLDQSVCDLILVEGFRHERMPKIEIHRPSLGKPTLFDADPGVIAVATDAPATVRTVLPLLDLNDPATISRFILDLPGIIGR